MKILVVSDTHGGVERLHEVVGKHRMSVDLVIHLGDNISDATSVMHDFPNIAFLGVKGNCDFSYMLSDVKSEGSFNADGIRIFYTHGHKYNVNYGVEYLASNAKLSGCEIALYGHTHVGFADKIGDVLVINPGSLSKPRDNSRGSYCLLEVKNNCVDYKIVEVE